MIRQEPKKKAPSGVKKPGAEGVMKKARSLSLPDARLTDTRVRDLFETFSGARAEIDAKIGLGYPHMHRPVRDEQTGDLAGLQVTFLLKSRVPDQSALPRSADNGAGLTLPVEYIVEETAAQGQTKGRKRTPKA